jgi:hypothetical protein
MLQSSLITLYLEMMHYYNQEYRNNRCLEMCNDAIKFDHCLDMVYYCNHILCDALSQSSLITVFLDMISYDKYIKCLQVVYLYYQFLPLPCSVDLRLHPLSRCD